MFNSNNAEQAKTIIDLVIKIEALIKYIRVLQPKQVYLYTGSGVTINVDLCV